jgi:hypothetical protein
MNKSPWSFYGRREENGSDGAASSKADPTLGAARELMLTHEQLKRYLDRTLREYQEIRAGRTGYGTLVEEALKPSPRPETIEERLRRLSAGGSNQESQAGDSPSPR